MPIPVEGYESKRIYVWFENVVGYLSAAKEWAQLNGTPEAWRDFWEDPAAKIYYFIGKDNIWFHTLSWPAQCLMFGDLNLPYDVPANQYVNFGGWKASTSLGTAPFLPDLPRALRRRTRCATTWRRSCRRTATASSARTTWCGATTRSWSRPGATWSTAC